MKMVDKRNIQIPKLDPVKFIERNNGTLKGYAVNTYHGLVKKYNQDRVSIIMNITKPNHKGRWPKCSYFAIFDGHGGNTCSDFLKQNMHKYITENDHFPYEPIEALKQGFKKAQLEFMKLAQSKQNLDKSGSCAIVILIIDQICYIANVGDSRAILSTQLGRKIFALSKDHKPDDPTQKERIVSNGGNIYQSVIKLKNGQNLPGPFRINPGKLSVSRAFGDIQAKLQKYNGNPKVLISKPQITYFQINPNQHDFIFMGSDGIFDKLTNQQIAQVVWDLHNYHQRKTKAKEKASFESLGSNISFKSPKNIQSQKNNSNQIDLQYIGQASTKIIQKAMTNYSLDNLTSLIIVLEDNGRSNLSLSKNIICSNQFKSEKVDQVSIPPIKKSQSNIRLKNQNIMNNNYISSSSNYQQENNSNLGNMKNNENKMNGINQMNFENVQKNTKKQKQREKQKQKQKTFEKLQKIDKLSMKRKSMGDTRNNDILLDFRSPNKISPHMNLTRKSSKTNVMNHHATQINQNGNIHQIKKESIWKLLNQQNNNKVLRPRG